jgi:hypothetical protein
MGLLSADAKLGASMAKERRAINRILDLRIAAPLLDVIHKDIGGFTASPRPIYAWRRNNFSK